MTTSSSGSLAPTSPIANLGNLYLNGAALSFLTTTTMSVGVGQVRDSTDTFDIIVGGNLVSSTSNPTGAQGTNNPVSGSAAVTINTAVNGAAGLDVGTIAADTFYYVHVIGDSLGFNNGSALLSLSATAPSLPLGYNCFRRVGTVLTGGAGVLLAFDQRGTGLDRTMTYRASIATDITAGSSATFAAVDVSDSIPRVSVTGIFKVHFTPTAADDELALRCGDSATDEGQAVASGSVAAVVTAAMLTCPVGATLASGVDYKVTGSAVAINVQGYVDQL